MQVCTYVLIYICMFAFMHVIRHVTMCVYMCMYVYMYVYIRMYIYMYLYLYDASMYIYICPYIYVCLCMHVNILYALKPGVQQDEKVRITNKTELEEIFQNIEIFMEAWQVLHTILRISLFTAFYPWRKMIKASGSRVIIPHSNEICSGSFQRRCIVPIV